MKKYLSFYGECYHPCGGMGDFIGDYDTKEEAIQVIEDAHKKCRPNNLTWADDWGSVWNTHERIEVWSK